MPLSAAEIKDNTSNGSILKLFKLLNFLNTKVVNLRFHILYVTLASPKLLCLGNENKSKLSFCISLDFM